MTVTEQDRERANGLMRVPLNAGDWAHCRDLLARALADERERARAPFLAYAAACTDIGNDRKAGVIKRAVNRSVAQAIRRAAEETDQ